jgi:hypothetical protein
MLELAVCAFAGLVALRHESDDWMKVERKRDDVLAGRGAMLDMVTQVERVRRVTWRMGVLGALVLSATLVAMRVIPLDAFVSAAVPSWIVVTSVLNFRAYHLEDEATQVVRSKAGKRACEDSPDEGFTSPHVL